MPKFGNLPIALVCVVLGIMLSVQFRTTQDMRSSLQYQRAEDLTQRIMQAEKERDELQDQVRTLRSTSAKETGAKDAENLKMWAGLVAFQGSGVIITLDDTKPPSGNKNPNLYRLQDEDILKVLNELRAAGAEAMSINNQRIIASTEVRTAGSSVSVNNKNIASPFEIKAIGDPATLESALKLRGGVIETMQLWGIQVSVKQQDNVQIPAFKGTARFDHARPVDEGGK